MMHFSILKFIYYFYICVSTYIYVDIPLSITIYKYVPISVIKISHLLSNTVNPKTIIIISIFIASCYHKITLVLFISFTRFLLTLIVSKVLIGKHRPDNLYYHNIHGFEHFSRYSSSLPSGHCQALWYNLYMLIKNDILNKNIWYYLICIFLSCSRLMLCKHFFSDAIFGGYIGYILSIR